jgi:hypothetical protein
MTMFGEWWDWYAVHSDKVNPIAAGLGGAALISAAIWQARTATNRHHEQTRADMQRRLTESFSKGVEQLASDKMTARLGGIYTLQRLAIEATSQQLPTRLRGRWKWPPPADPVFDLYWTVMETLTAFVRERTQPQAKRIVPLLDRSVVTNSRKKVSRRKTHPPPLTSRRPWR